MDESNENEELDLTPIIESIVKIINKEEVDEDFIENLN